MEPYNSAALFHFDLAIEQARRCTVAGTDEAGRGPLAGPVVAAAVRLDLSAPLPGINDSKKLSAPRREALYDLITTRALSWAVAHASVEEIERLNILQASLLAMQRALNMLSAPWTLALVDGNRPIGGLPASRQSPVVSGDAKSASIAAASILAKVSRDRLMMEYHAAYPVYGFDAHKGYPTRLHRAKLLEHGLCPVHRQSFCKNILSRTPPLSLSSQEE